MKNLPVRLQKYIVQQEDQNYTPVDHAVWRYILRQLRNYLSEHAHEFYLEGLEATGISTDSIPKISDISKKLEKFGWRALPVSGFIPPAVFMELQALGVLPIAADMRTISHLMYTPAPDIVHEAAGHAPMLAHPEYGDYLRQYATVARKAIISSEDLAVYEAIRVLSDVKENPDSTPEEIDGAQKALESVSAQVSHVSEATELSRMNWWTAEYGLIGPLKNPKIFGAGILSSVGEARWCLSDKVKKIPLTVECTQRSYDITEPQPQLFVTPSFAHLGDVLHEFSKSMAYRKGGRHGMDRAIRAKTVNTAELNSGLQISFRFTEVLEEDGEIVFLKSEGPGQLCFKDEELPDQGRKQHPSGFSTPIGRWKKAADRCPSTFHDEDLQKLGLDIGETGELEFTSGFKVKGRLKAMTRRNGRLILLQWEDCTVTRGSTLYFSPDWGVFDMAVGSEVVSVYGGPADPDAFGEGVEFKALRVRKKPPSPTEQTRHQRYIEIRRWREAPTVDEKSLASMVESHKKDFPGDWLLFLDAYELARSKRLRMADGLRADLQNLTRQAPPLKPLIDEGLALLAKA